MRTFAFAFMARGKALLLELAADVTSCCRLRRRCSVWGWRIASCRLQLSDARKISLSVLRCSQGLQACDAGRCDYTSRLPTTTTSARNAVLLSVSSE